jgi:hypothetical protein
VIFGYRDEQGVAMGKREWEMYGERERAEREGKELGRGEGERLGWNEKRYGIGKGVVN